MTRDKNKRKGNIEKNRRIDNQANHDANDFQRIPEGRLETNKYSKTEKF